MIRSGHHDIPSEADTPSEPSEEEADDHEEEAYAEAEQAGPEQAAPHHEEPHHIQPADPEIPLQTEPPLQQADPPTFIQTASLKPPQRHLLHILP